MTMTEKIHAIRQPGETMTEAAHRIQNEGSKPDKPSAITITGITTTGFEASWDTVATATSYNVAVSPAVDGYPKDIGKTNVKLIGLTASTKYTLSIKACNVSGCSVAATKKVTTTTADNHRKSKRKAK